MDADGRKLPPNLVLRNGIYHTRVQVDGKSLWRSTGKTTEREAIAKGEEIRAQLRNAVGTGEAKKGEVPTFRQWANRHREVYSLAKEFPEQDTIILEPALRFRVKGSKMLGDVRLNEITRSMAVAYLNHRRSTVAESTAEINRRVLKSVFERAIDEGYIAANPFSRKRSDKRWKVVARVRVLSLENEPKLRDAFDDSHFDRWLTFMLYTGLRITEARGITIDELNPARGLLMVPAKYAKRKKAREVPLFPEALEAAQRQHMVFNRARGKLWFYSGDNYRDHLQRAAERAGIPHLSPHDLRHTFATRYLQGGGNIKVLSLILGHASVATTEAFYTHLTAPDVRELSRHVQMPICATDTTCRSPKSTESIGAPRLKWL